MALSQLISLSFSDETRVINVDSVNERTPSRYLHAPGDPLVNRFRHRFALVALMLCARRRATRGTLVSLSSIFRLP